MFNFSFSLVKRQFTTPERIFNLSNMLKKSLHRTPKFKPAVKNSSRPKLNMTRHEKVEILITPIKSGADKKHYKTIRLENGLTALLISDPSKPVSSEDASSSEEESSSSGSESGMESEGGKSTHSEASDKVTSKKSDYDEEKLAACALSVGVGSYSDPSDIQGLAHFVEHMVFMGSEKYQKENEFDSFIKKKGGSDNASTGCETTTFYFEIQEKHLAQGMDIFSQFFVSPLMKKEAMQREREAIESEFAIAVPSDSNRRDQLLASLFPSGHPARTFTWGNLRSLKDELNDDDKLYEAAHLFRRKHYSAHRMTLAVQARMDLPTLEKYVVNTFGLIPNNQIPADDFEPYKFTPGNVTEEFKSLYYVKPISDANEVQLTWCMRSMHSEYQSKPHQYISYLLGHEGKGSLLSYLKKQVWALGIYTGNSETGMDYTSIYSLFTVQVVLTKNGLEHVDQVLKAVFSYINMLKKLGPSERIYNEIKTIEDTSFRFEEETEPSDYVENLAENMHLYPPEHYITGDSIYYKYDPEGITDLLNTMTADSVNVMILSNKYSTPINYDVKEKWFGTEYRKEEIPKEWINSWLEVKPYSEFHMPDKNIYLTSNFDLITPAPEYIEEARTLNIDLENSTLKDIYTKVSKAKEHDVIMKKDDLIATVSNFRLDQPNLFRKNRHMEVWYKPDFKFRFPTALLYFYFITPLSLKSPKESCLLDIWTDVLQQNLKESVYPANMADLSHSIYVGDKGLTLKASGYNQNLHLLVDLISLGMRNSADSTSDMLFEAVRDARSRIYHNILIKPHKLSKDLRMQVLLEPYLNTREKAAVVNNVTLADLKEFSKKFLSQFYLQVLVQGNVAWHEAIHISDNVYKNIKWEGLEESQIPEFRVHQIPLGDNRLRVMSLNTHSTNSIVTNYYQGEAITEIDGAVIEILMMIMEEPVFDNLRTKEQLGYSVFSMMRYTFGVLGYSVTVNTQADKFSVAHVDKRIEAFLKKFSRDSVKKLNEKTLASTKSSIAQLKNSIDYELKEEVERNWREIVSREYQFHRLYKESEAVQKVKLSDIRNWVENHFSTGNKSQYRKLSVQVMGHKSASLSNVTKEPEMEQMKGYDLMYLNQTTVLDDTKEDANEFINNIDDFKRNLPLINVPKVNLVYC